MSDERIEKIEKLKFTKDKELSLIAYLLLLYLLKIEYKIELNKNEELEYNLHKKPFLKNYKEIYFNISHCTKKVVCVVDDEEVGVDVENYKEFINFKDMEISSIFSINEIDEINSNEKEKILCKLWTQKESYVKYKGFGLDCSLVDLDFSSKNIKNITENFLNIKGKGYCFTVCSKKKISNKIISNVSEENLITVLLKGV